MTKLHSETTSRHSQGEHSHNAHSNECIVHLHDVHVGLQVHKQLAGDYSYPDSNKRRLQSAFARTIRIADNIINPK